MKCETCQSEATIHIKMIGLHFCALCVQKIDARISQINQKQKAMNLTTATVKVMRSHDYCHFEVSLSTDTANTISEVDSLRKEAARLADKAVEQYKVAKSAANRIEAFKSKWQLEMANEVPESERTPEMKAIIKFHNDEAFRSRFTYDYEDDYNPDDDEDMR